MAIPVILDVDPGIDDALAILLAIQSPEIDLVGVTTVAGNVPVERGTRNARAVLDAAGAGKVGVHPGAARPLAGRLTTASFFHGVDGLGGVLLPEPNATSGGAAAATYLVEAAREHPGLTVVGLAPATNLALACLLDPSWTERLRAIVLMGGAIACPGNVTPVAEANVYSDPEAAAIVLQRGAGVTMVGLDVTMQARLTSEHLDWFRREAARSGGPVAEVAGSLMAAYLEVAQRVGSPSAALHDPLAVAFACIPELITTRRMRVEVETAGVLTRGQTVAWRDGSQEVRVSRGEFDDVIGVEPVAGMTNVAVGVDAERFLRLFLDRLSGDGGRWAGQRPQ